VATKVFAENHNIPVHYTPSKGRSLSGWNAPTPFDLGVVVSFGYFVTPEILRTLPLGALNVHPSVLPLYRGASPIQYTIMNRDEVGGVSVQELDDKTWDAGRILAQAKVVSWGSAWAKGVVYVPCLPLFLKDLKTEPPKSYDDLRDKLSLLGVELLVDTIRNLHSRKVCWCCSCIVHIRNIH